ASREREELRGGELHVVYPVLLFVEVRRTSRCGLTDARMRDAERIRGFGLAPQQRGIGAWKDARREREDRRELSRRRRKSRRPILVREDSLCASRACVNGTLLPLAPSVVRRIGSRQIEVGVIAIVAELVVQLRVAREHAQQPLDAVSRFVEHIRGAVRTWQAVRRECVSEYRRVIAV